MASGERAGAAAAEVSVEAVEALIRELPGVLGARLVVNDWGGVREIHILADRGRPAKSVVRDVESALLARWGLQVDHKRISVAQVVNQPRRPHAVRLRVQRLTLATDAVRGETEVTVRLALVESPDAVAPDADAAAQAWEGSAAGDAGTASALRLTVAATVAALNQALAPGHSFASLEATASPMGGHELVNVLVRYRAPRGFYQLLAGAAVVHAGGLDAGVRAVLQATNRMISVALRRRDEDGGEAEADADAAGTTEAGEELEETADEVAAAGEAGSSGWPDGPA